MFFFHQSYNGAAAVFGRGGVRLHHLHPGQVVQLLRDRIPRGLLQVKSILSFSFFIVHAFSMGNHARWMLRDASLSGENKTAVKEFLNSACPNHDADAVSWESLDVRKAR